MRCFFHRGEEAVGVCAQCHKAVCSRCVKVDGAMVFCPDHSVKTYATQFTKYYIMAIDFAREAAARGVRTAELIERLEREGL